MHQIALIWLTAHLNHLNFIKQFLLFLNLGFDKGQLKLHKILVNYRLIYSKKFSFKFRKIFVALSRSFQSVRNSLFHFFLRIKFRFLTVNKFVQNLETHFKGLWQNITLLRSSIQTINNLFGIKGRFFKLRHKLAELIKVIQVLGGLVQIVLLLIVWLGIFTIERGCWIVE